MMKKKKKQQQQGFTLIETIITMSLFFVILYGVYVMIQHYGDVTKTEHSRMTMQQESRYMVSAFADEIKEAGAVLTMAHTYMGGSPFFNGIYPLNSSYYPDGLIVATGDPEASTQLAQDFSASGDTVLYVDKATVESYDPSFPYENPQWTAGQKGIVIGTTGYFVFSVASVDTASGAITIRAAPVYYSGLLMTGFYYDDALGNPAGNTITYSAKSMVTRLTNFSIYVFRDINHPSLKDEYGYPQVLRQMVRITDTKGNADPLADGSDAEFSAISENIWDMQISYKAYTNTSFSSADRHTAVDPNHLYFTQGSAYTDPYTAMNALMADLQLINLKQVDVTYIAIADELGGQGKVSNDGDIPPIGDNTYNYLPDRKLSYRLFSFSVEPRNFNIMF